MGASHARLRRDPILAYFFKAPRERGSTSAIRAAAARRGQRRAIELLRQRIEHKLRPMLVGREGTVNVIAEGQRLIIRLGAARVFDAGQAALRPEALPVLDAVIAEIKPWPPAASRGAHRCRAVGEHALPHKLGAIGSPRRKCVVYVEEVHHVRPDHLAAVGHAATRPIASGDIPEARETNRRIELVVELATDEEVNVATR